MRNTSFWWILLGFMVLLDIYIFQVLKSISFSYSARAKILIYSGYWVISILAILFLLFFPLLRMEKQLQFLKSVLFSLVVGLFLAKIIAALFFMIDDIRRGLQWIFEKLFTKKGEAINAQGEERISRSAFLSWAGMIAGGSLFGTLIYGFSNKYKYRIIRQPIAFQNIPTGLKGLKIVQISDIHSGSFNNKKAVLHGIDMILKEQPDLILFTGDLVNNIATEMDEYMDVFGLLKAPLGVYSVLGNHDYGDYIQWENAEAKIANLEKLKSIHQLLGWKLLLNEHTLIERNGDKLSLIGVENWSSKARFPKYGDLKKAYKGTDVDSFKILMSHDPSHWRAEVLQDYADISLMLSGHTHGMQFGVEIPGFKWSPIQYMYQEWAGLYEHGAQKLYVSRGFGFLGYPGRVGILPEITVIELV